MKLKSVKNILSLEIASNIEITPDLEVPTLTAQFVLRLFVSTLSTPQPRPRLPQRGPSESSSGRNIFSVKIN